MGLTLDELKLLKKTFEELDLFPDQRVNVERDVIPLIEREIKLKTTDPVTGKKIDAQGNFIPDDGH